MLPFLLHMYAVQRRSDVFHILDAVFSKRLGASLGFGLSESDVNREVVDHDILAGFHASI